MLINFKMQKSEINESDDFQQMKPFKSKYTKTSMKKKQLLIEMVVSQKLSIYRASKKLNISNSTAKAILNNYNKYGAILERNTKSSIEKIFTLNPIEGQNQLPDETIKEEIQIKHQEVDQPLYGFSQEERRLIIQNMGIAAQSYPLVELPLPYFYHFYKI